MHLRVRLGGLIFDYRATVSAARNFIQDWRQTHFETIELVLDTIEQCRKLPRLPCERLFLDPVPK
ncbi:hypothetical protein [Nocardia sp. NPDC004123]